MELTTLNRFLQVLCGFGGSSRLVSRGLGEVGSLTLHAVFLLYWLVVIPSSAQAQTVVVTNYALELVVTELLVDAGKVTTILPKSADIHTFEPKPSQLLAITKASVIYANGNSLEPWLKRATLSSSQAIVSLSDFSEKAKNNNDALWLDPVIVKNSIPSLVEALFGASFSECSTISDLGAEFIMKLDALSTELQTKILSWKRKIFLVYHNLYDAFAERFKLSLLGGLKSCEMDSLTGSKLEILVSQIKVARLSHIGVEELEEVERSGVVEDLKLKAVLLDPFGVAASSYAQLISRLVEQVALLSS